MWHQKHAAYITDKLNFFTSIAFCYVKILQANKYEIGTIVVKKIKMIWQCKSGILTCFKQKATNYFWRAVKFLLLWRVLSI